MSRAGRGARQGKRFQRQNPLDLVAPPLGMKAPCPESLRCAEAGLRRKPGTLAPWAGESLEPGTRQARRDGEGGNRQRGAAPPSCSSQLPLARGGHADLVTGASVGVLHGWVWRLRPFSENICLLTPGTTIPAPTPPPPTNRNPP